MNKLSSILSPDRILVDCAITSKKRALELLSKLLTEDLEHDIDYQDLLAAFVKRENLGSTVIGKGIAIPHARLAEISEAYAAIIKLYEPITYDDQEEPVDLLIGIILPENNSELSLNVLKAFASKLKNPDCYNKIQASNDAHTLYQIFTQDDETITS